MLLDIAKGTKPCYKLWNMNILLKLPAANLNSLSGHGSVYTAGQIILTTQLLGRGVVFTPITINIPSL